MERIAYTDCEKCHGKGWYLSTCEREEGPCEDCAFKNGAEAMRELCLSRLRGPYYYRACEAVGEIDVASLKQPPLCMCEDVKRAEHEHGCPLHAEAVTTNT